MPAEDDPDEAGTYSAPLPPDDRLWRHPSELATGPTPAWQTGAHPGLVTVLAAGLVGAVLAGAVVAALDLNDGGSGPGAVERVAVTPVASLAPAGVAAEVGDTVRPAVAELTAAGRVGSAVVFRDDGHLVTSARLVGDATRVEIRLAGTTSTGTVIGRDELTDVAVVHIDAHGLPTMVRGSTDSLAIGSALLAVGASDPGRRCTLSATGRVTLDESGTALHGMLQTDSTWSASSTGGALVDAGGSLVGLLSSGATPNGFGSAVPVEVAWEVADDIVATGAAVHPWLGMEGSDLDPESAAEQHLDGGVLVRRVAAEGPAATAGLRPGDVIIAVDRNELTSMSALVSDLRRRDPGDALTVEFERAGTDHSASVLLGTPSG